MTAIDGALRLWFALTLVALALVVVDLVRSSAITIVMKWGWALVVAYTGPVGLVIYLWSCREPLPRAHEAYVAPLWKQAVGSTIHCVAGDATGIIAGALIGVALVMPPRVDAIVEYVAGFAFGLFIFQALFMKVIMGGGYAAAIRRTLFPEWLSMNALMGGMFPVMSILMRHDPAAMRPSGLRFWGVMSAAIMVGAVVAYPFNAWLVANALKHGMGTANVLGRGGDGGGIDPHQPPPHVAARSVTGATVASLTVLAIGLWLAVRYGNL
ncbi:MAG: DUF4396 domain-containing protein [bacterium]